MKIISENQKIGFVIIIDELENWFRGANNKQIDSIGTFIQFLAEFTHKHKDVILIISLKEIERNFNFLKILEIRLG